MPVARGVIRAVASDDPQTRAMLVITSEHWNSWTNWVGAVPLRRSAEPYEAPYSVELDSGLFGVASRIVALPVPPHPEALLGRILGAVNARELERCEDALCAFLQVPLLLGSAVRSPRVVGEPDYPLWGEIYYAEPLISGQLKRYIVVSPNPWNAVSGMVSVVRTTSQLKPENGMFPAIQRGKVQAVCGELTTIPRGDVKFGRRAQRPDPMTTTRPEMSAIARGFLMTHDLEAAAARSGI